jgi:hypothetical protein
VDLKNIQNETCIQIFLLEEIGEESMGESNETGVVDVHFVVEDLEVDSLRAGEVVAVLNTGVEEDAVDFWMGGHDARGRVNWEVWKLGEG